MRSKSSSQAGQEMSGVIDDEFFERVFAENSRMLFRLCCKLVDDKNEAENIIQDVFESLWKRRHSLEITTSVEGYLIRAVKLRTLKFYRERSYRPLHDGALIPEDSLVSNDSTEQDVFYHDLKDRVEVVVNHLPKQCRKVMKMSLESGLSNREIASSLLISESAVEQHKAKARNILRKKLELSSI